MLEGREAFVTLGCFDARLSLAGIYRGIPDPVSDRD
jgi:hypothetical protein